MKTATLALVLATAINPLLTAQAADRATLADAVAQHTGLPADDAARSVDALLAAITAALGNGEQVSLADFGTFSVRERPARTGRDPRTGDPVHHPAQRTVRFRPADALKQAVTVQPEAPDATR